VVLPEPRKPVRMVAGIRDIQVFPSTNANGDRMAAAKQTRDSV